ncbi:hypothetical protein [Pelomonas sp. KK5]|uniref:hypothetical protein n=1 Tax=Pelomonas sp. KK5 TaxID=1855730 RepID=UPI00097C5CF5|nr:hypothetical protein [Pelomonas sp. KK5]
MAVDFKRQLWASTADALGFVIGGLAGRQIGLALGLDFFSADGHWNTPQIAGLLLILAGTGAGRFVFRWLFTRLGKI